MGIFKHILMISLLLTSIAANSLHAQDEGVIPEAENAPGTYVPQINTGAPTPPVIIDESDSSGASDNDDFDNN
jgi:hypothetical protein